MRLISQNGTVDISYENSVLSIKNNIFIGSSLQKITCDDVPVYIYCSIRGDTIYTMGKYNDVEEAKGILKRVRNSNMNNMPYFQFPEKEIREKEEISDVE